MSLAGSGATANGTQVILWDCNNSPEQDWVYSAQGSWYGTWRNYKAGKCMSTAGCGGTANGTNVIIWDCNGNSEQTWDYID